MIKYYWVLLKLPVNIQARPNPMGTPKIAPANKLRNTEPGIANVCLKRYAEPKRSNTSDVWLFFIVVNIDA